ncbi:hypothetical protein ACE41H_20300 [Paenibacillus enshidis]|uniref:Uncharacterized protein n=1 Tax=Paenibacillus enshidis TaxID=1458439 RepID=A0ABV5B0I3_9BACL
MTNTKQLNIQNNKKDYDTYESILSNLGESKQAWLDLLQYNGINYIWQETLDFLLQTEADLRKWNKFWSGSIDSLIADISDYRQYRIAKSHADLTLAEFERIYRGNARKALERLFVEPISDHVVKMLNDTGMDYAHIYNMRIQGTIERSHECWGFRESIADKINS